MRFSGRPICYGALLFILVFGVLPNTAAAQIKIGVAEALLARLYQAKGDSRKAVTALEAIREPWLQLHPQVVVERDRILRALGTQTLAQREQLGLVSRIHNMIGDSSIRVWTLFRFFDEIRGKVEGGHIRADDARVPNRNVGCGGGPFRGIVSTPALPHRGSANVGCTRHSD